MEFLEVILMILFVIFAVVSKANKEKKRAAGGAANARQPKPEPRAVNRPLTSANRPAAAQPAAAQPAPAVQSVEGTGMLDDELCAGGSMPHEHTEGRDMLADAECVSGSMAHGHSEGMSRKEMAERMARLDAQRVDVAQPIINARNIDPKALRRAVVMAEVLGKPRALSRGARR